MKVAMPKRFASVLHTLEKCNAVSLHLGTPLGFLKNAR